MSQWQTRPFEECIEKITYSSKIQRKDFLDQGSYPIISQEHDFINGYWDNEADLFKVTTPIVVFGDHTKVLKYVDFDFVLGADGVKILQPRDFLLPKYFFYMLQTANLDSLGYARHYKLLKELEVTYPDRVEQQRIVGILDQAFDGIANAKANGEKNLQNARALFESHLQSVFTQHGEGWVERADTGSNAKLRTHSMPQETSPNAAIKVDLEGNRGRVTKTGGRDATLRHISGELSLAVGMPSTRARTGWRWTSLADLARLESGHTPSRRHPEYWDGPIPWIGILDARENHGQRITDTSQTTNELGIANSSARVLPENTVCLSRTASVGYVVVMGRPMATSQDFVNWVCSGRLIPDYLKYLFLAEGRDGLLRYASGAVHQTIYFPEAKAFHICHPGIKEQTRIVQQCDALRAETQRLQSVYQLKLAALDELKKSLLHQAFSGNL